MRVQCEARRTGHRSPSLVDLVESLTHKYSEKNRPPNEILSRSLRRKTSAGKLNKNPRDRLIDPHDRGKRGVKGRAENKRNRGGGEGRKSNQTAADLNVCDFPEPADAKGGKRASLKRYKLRGSSCGGRIESDEGPHISGRIPSFDSTFVESTLKLGVRTVSNAGLLWTNAEVGKRNKKGSGSSHRSPE